MNEPKRGQLSLASKLGLGTVQFGLEYGIANRKGRPRDREVRRILTAARAAGVRTLDTAPLYGESEAVLGRCCLDDWYFEIVTKTGVLERPITIQGVGGVRSTFMGSLERLGRSSVYGILAHDAEDLLRPGGDLLYRELEKLRSERLVTKIGVSVYSSAILRVILDRFSIDLVQVPLNLLDQRMTADGTLALLRQRGVEVHARSVFLQGLLLLKPDALPPHLQHANSCLEAVQTFATDSGVSVAGLSLGYVRDRLEVDRLILGVDSAEQFRLNCRSFLETEGLGLDCQHLACNDTTVIDPRRWHSRV